MTEYYCQHCGEVFELPSRHEPTRCPECLRWEAYINDLDEKTTSLKETHSGR